MFFHRASRIFSTVLFVILHSSLARIMVTAGIDLQGLQQELDGFKNRFEAWTQETVGAAESRRDEHFTRLRELQGGARTRGLLGYQVLN
jgi:hypothetical protein